MNFSIQRSTLLIGLACFPLLVILANTGHAQSSLPELRIGDLAPDLEIEHWFSDDGGALPHATKLKDDHIYVIEFWATWCRPCVEQMPMISRLQKQFQDEHVQFISISDETPETIEQFLDRNVSPKQTYRELTSNYCLVSDPDKSVKKDYFRAAGQLGIPATFIVGKSGRIEWIGPTDQLEEPLRRMIANDWDRDEFQVKLNLKKEVRRKAAEAKRRLSRSLSQFQLLLRKNRPKKAINLVDQLLADEEFKSRSAALQRLRMNTLVDFNLEQADEAVKEFTENNEDPNELNKVAWNVVKNHYSRNRIKPSRELLAQAKQTADYAVRLAPNNGFYLDTLAHLVYIVDGDVDKALKIQSKAIRYAGEYADKLKPFYNELKAAQIEAIEKQKP